MAVDAVSIVPDMEYTEPSSNDVRESDGNHLGEKLSKLGLDIAVTADVLGEIADVSTQDREQFSAFVGELNMLQETTKEISINISEATTVATEANEKIHGSRSTVDEAGEEIKRMIDAVKNSEDRMEQLSNAIENVGGIISVINSIAKQTNLLALNATIEAARAGEAGKGFSVVANEVKGLASSTSNATTQIEETLAEIKNGFESLKVTSQETSSTALNVGKKTETFGAILDNVSEAMTTIDRKTGIIDQQMGVVSDACQEFVTISDNVSHNLEDSTEKLNVSAKTMRSVADDTDKMVLRTALNGSNKSERDVINFAVYAQEKVSAIISDGVEKGLVTLDELFERNHDEIPGTNPLQHLAKHSKFIDAHIQPVIEEVVAGDDRIAWCAMIDDTAYITANILAVSKPQGDDPIWNMANCRNHRYFPDRAAKRAGQNKEPLLLQTYRRDMGGGVFVPMKDISAPIVIGGRHWGGFRIGYTP